ncbi:MAG TPA: MraY family glycosyltransferase [Terracidiphilus sp.]|nr:MraY family glycosyltransferase [Terracidiphilus sp.]
MYSLVFLAVVSFVLCLLVTPLVRNSASRLGIVDIPDQNRKVHTVPVPRLGGVAIFASAFIAYGLLLLAKFAAGGIVWSGFPLAIRLLPAVLLVFGIGIVDDIRGVRPWHKLTVQIIAAVLAWYVGIHVDVIAGQPVSQIGGLLITILWIVACTNAVNLIDGVDGLAAGVGLFATLTTLIAALLIHNIALALATVPLAGALLAFLRFNFNPASIFLGDCGSLTLGFLLGCYGCVWSQKATTFLGMTAPILALAVPLFDTALAIARRFLRRRPIFGADQAHIHHKLLSRGMTPRGVALVLYGACGVAAIASLFVTICQEQYRGIVIALVCLAAWGGLQYLGYHEFATSVRLILGDAFRGLLDGHLTLVTFEHQLSKATTLEECWKVLSAAYTQFDFSGIVFDIDGVFHELGADAGWHVYVDYPGHGYITLTRKAGATTHSPVAVAFIDCISRILESKLGQLENASATPAASAHAD